LLHAIPKTGGNYQLLGFQFFKQFDWTLDKAKEWLKSHPEYGSLQESKKEYTPPRSIEREKLESIIGKRLTDQVVSAAHPDQTTPATRTPGWAEEMLITPDKTKKKERNETLLEAEEAYARFANLPFYSSFSPKPTLAELKEEAQKMAISRLEDELKHSERQIRAYENIENKYRSEVERNVEIQHDYPEYPIVAEKIKQEVAAWMKGHAENFEKIKKAIPFLEEIKSVYEQTLKTRMAASEEQKENVSRMLEETRRFGEKARKIIGELTPLGASLITTFPSSASFVILVLTNCLPYS
jgi:hypothetical protein